MSKPAESAPPFKIGPDRRFITTFGTIISLLGATIFATWTIRGALNDIEYSIKDLSRKFVELSDRVDSKQAETSSQIERIHKDMADQVKKTWLAEEQYRWAGQLRWEFRKSEFSIPEPRDFRIP